ncbi:hypothetical protein [Maridesulfovibrio sp. FT414]|uniref:hypothetical protein n=1 Tax=Maridesulfovibrio sp. FT414 TaxID=2979469 RepID=UPI003D802C84
MDSFFQFFVAVLAGVATADLFVRGWNGFLECSAAFILFFQKKIPASSIFSRLNSTLPITVLSFLALVLCFKVYFSVLGFGRTEMEQLGYFLGAMPRTGYYLVHAGKMIDSMFKS